MLLDSAVTAAVAPAAALLLQSLLLL